MITIPKVKKTEPAAIVRLPVTKATASILAHGLTRIAEGKAQNWTLPALSHDGAKSIVMFELIPDKP